MSNRANNWKQNKQKKNKMKCRFLSWLSSIIALEIYLILLENSFQHFGRAEHVLARYVFVCLFICFLGSHLWLQIPKFLIHRLSVFHENFFEQHVVVMLQLTSFLIRVSQTRS